MPRSRTWKSVESLVANLCLAYPNQLLSARCWMRSAAEAGRPSRSWIRSRACVRCDVTLAGGFRWFCFTGFPCGLGGLGLGACVRVLIIFMSESFWIMPIMRQVAAGMCPGCPTCPSTWGFNGSDRHDRHDGHRPLGLSRNERVDSRRFAAAGRVNILTDQYALSF